VFYNTQSKDPLLIAHQLQDKSSGTPYPRANYITCANFSISNQNFLAPIAKVIEPQHYHEAVKDPHWWAAIGEEIQALEKNNTWTLEDLLVGKKPIHCKWVYHVKYNSDGAIQRLKARLVIQGDNQVEDLDYNETFMPVAKMTSVRCFLSVAVSKGCELHQMDVNSAFLRGDLEEEVFMALPPGSTCSNSIKVG